MTAEAPDYQPVAVARFPGHVRGLMFAGRFAFVGMSQMRKDREFLFEELNALAGELKCGIAAVDLSTGNICGEFRFTNGCSELFDVQFLPGFRQPMILSHSRPESSRAWSLREAGFWSQENGQKQLRHS
jgi:uncharacterized protein (TIGR03032 family)